MQRLSRITVGCSVLVTLEVLAYLQGGMYSTIAAVIWFCLILLAIPIVLSQIVCTFNDLLTRRQCGILIALLLALTLLIYPLFLHTIDWEAAYQVHEGTLKLNEQTFGYTDSGFLGYPARQYSLVALPSVIFGRHFWTLHLGYALPFILGFLLFCSGLISVGVPSYLALIASLLLLTSEHLVSSYLRFEQLILPPAFTLLLVGELLHHVTRPSVVTLLATTTIALLLSASYTPGLSTIVLVIAAMIVWRQIYLLPVSLLVIFHAALATAYSSNLVISLEQPGRGSLISSAILTRVLTALGLVGAPFDTMSLIPPLLIIPWFIYLAISIISPTRLRVLINLWAITVIAASASLKGYSLFPVELELNRAMTIVPVLTAALAWECRGVKVRYGWRVKSLCAAVILAYGSILIYRYQAPYDIRAALVEALSNIETTKTPRLHLITRQVINANDFIPYFFPEMILHPDAATSNHELCPANLSEGIWYFEDGLCDHLFRSLYSRRNISVTKVMHLQRIVVLPDQPVR